LNSSLVVFKHLPTIIWNGFAMGFTMLMFPMLIANSFCDVVQLDHSQNSSSKSLEFLGDVHMILSDCLHPAGGRITAMEATFTWLGGWRPSSAILLVYSLMGVQLEDEIRNFGYGLRDLTNTSAVLSHRQITNLTNVQKTTGDAERKLSKKLAYIQVLENQSNH